MKTAFLIWLKEFATALLVVLALSHIYNFFMETGSAEVFGIFFAPFVVMQHAAGRFLSAQAKGQELVLPAYMLAMFLLPVYFLRIAGLLARRVVWSLWTLAWSAVCIIIGALPGI